MGIQRFGPQARQFDLTDRGRRLRIGEAAAAAMRQAELRRAEGDRPRRYEDNLGVSPQRGDFGASVSQAMRARLAILFHQQCRTDLDHKAIGARQVC